MVNIQKEYQRLKELGKIDGLIGADNVGKVIDMYNNDVDRKHEKYFLNEINARNAYYWKLWKLAIEDIRSGVRLPPREVREREKLEKRYIILPKGGSL